MITRISDERLLKMCVSDDFANKIIAAWKPEHGELLDFGGGEKDVLASDVYSACNGSAKNAAKLFGITKQESEFLLSAIR